MGAERQRLSPRRAGAQGTPDARLLCANVSGTNCQGASGRRSVAAIMKCSTMSVRLSMSVLATTGSGEQGVLKRGDRRGRGEKWARRGTKTIPTWSPRRKPENGAVPSPRPLHAQRASIQLPSTMSPDPFDLARFRDPAMNRWAIVGCPSGTASRRGDRDGSFAFRHGSGGSRHPAKGCRRSAAKWRAKKEARVVLEPGRVLLSLPE
jgi:hypothetical protein